MRLQQVTVTVNNSPEPMAVMTSEQDKTLVFNQVARGLNLEHPRVVNIDNYKVAGFASLGQNIFPVTVEIKNA